MIYLSIKYIDRFCITQNKPTQKSANAKLAKKKFVIERKRRDNVTTSMTSKFPKQQQNTIVYNVINMTRTSVRSNIYSLELTLSASLYELLLSVKFISLTIARPLPFANLWQVPDIHGHPHFLYKRKFHDNSLQLNCCILHMLRHCAKLRLVFRWLLALGPLSRSLE
uniref:Uncharacterized protein n=1 Tax=Glossina pallidipes TaxID=7398 RepID=A0A1B0A872_GLOPL